MDPEERKMRDRRYWMKQYYGIEYSRYEELFVTQEGLCAVCGEPPGEGEFLAVDHDHSCCPTGRACGNCVRGLMHRKCNRAIGLLGDDPAVLERAAHYLRAFHLAVVEDHPSAAAGPAARLVLVNPSSALLP